MRTGMKTVLGSAACLVGVLTIAGCDGATAASSAGVAQTSTSSSSSATPMLVAPTPTPDPDAANLSRIEAIFFDQHNSVLKPAVQAMVNALQRGGGTALWAAVTKVADIMDQTDHMLAPECPSEATLAACDINAPDGLKNSYKLMLATDAGNVV